MEEVSNDIFQYVVDDRKKHGADSPVENSTTASAALLRLHLTLGGTSRLWWGAPREYCVVIDLPRTAGGNAGGDLGR